VPRAYLSVVRAHPADALWAHIRSFGAYASSGLSGESVVEDAKSGDQVGEIRRVATTPAKSASAAGFPISIHRSPVSSSAPHRSR
jgi:hypothetical protein